MFWKTAIPKNPESSVAERKSPWPQSNALFDPLQAPRLMRNLPVAQRWQSGFPEKVLPDVSSVQDTQEAAAFGMECWLLRVSVKPDGD